MIELLLNAGAKLNTGFTPPLHIAVARERHDVVRYLVERGADLNLEDGDGAPPLFWTGVYGPRYPDIKMIRLLIELGADINRRDGVGRTVEDWLGPAIMREASAAK